MSFGQKILEKYGYKDGDGLGKNGSGIKTAIKANFKVRKIIKNCARIFRIRFLVR